MSAEFVVILLLGAFCGGFINGLAAFGTSLFALGWWLHILPPLQAVAIVLVMSVASGIQGVVLVRRAIQWRRLCVFLIPGLIGIPIGLHILHLIDADFLKIVVSVFMLIYGGYFFFKRDLPAVAGQWPVLDATIGFAGGVLGAIAGLSGALPTMWISMRNWTKEASRAVLQPYNVIVLGISAGLLAIDGAYSANTLFLILIALPSTMIAAQAGLWCFKRLDDSQFRRLLIAMMLIAGLGLQINIWLSPP